MSFEYYKENEDEFSTRLVEVAQVSRLDAYVASYQPPPGSGISIEDAAAAVREVREAS